MSTDASNDGWTARDTGTLDTASRDSVAEDSPQATDAAEERADVTDAQLEGAMEAGEASSTCDPDAGVSARVTPPVACALIAQDRLWSSAGPANNIVFGAACEKFCDGLCSVAVSYWRCFVAQDYIDAFDALLPEAGNSGPAIDAGADGGFVCPTWSDQVIIRCQAPPVGRRTESARTPPTDAGAGVVSVARELAERAYLESVSVHAFATLERELQAHQAPPSLLRQVRRARRDEVRHAAMMRRLARRFGAAPRPFEAPAPHPARELAAIAVENAVEGCVRETYGAVVGLLEARMSRDPEVRRIMGSISADECRHAELAWMVAAWIGPRLAEQERELVNRGARDAIMALSREGDDRIVRQLATRVWTRYLRTAPKNA